MKIEKTFGKINEIYKESSTCESCGNEFNCGANRKVCWCMDLTLTDEARAEIKAKFNDCLCNQCLDKYSVTSE